MKDAGVAATDINEVLLVGGMTRMPRVSPLPTVQFLLCCLSALSHSAPPFMLRVWQKLTDVSKHIDDAGACNYCIRCFEGWDLLQIAFLYTLGRL